MHVQSIKELVSIILKYIDMLYVYMIFAYYHNKFMLSLVLYINNITLNLMKFISFILSII